LDDQYIDGTEGSDVVDDLVLAPAWQQCAALREKRITARALLELYLDRVARFNPAINAIIALDAEGALARADAADEALAAGKTWGPLHGLPMTVKESTVKESFDFIGLPTTWGKPELVQNIPNRNAAAVQRLLDAGAIIFGKTNVPLLLGDWQSFNEIYGTTNNPWDLSRVPGGSSGGSAATRPIIAVCTVISLPTASCRSGAKRCRVSSPPPISRLSDRWPGALRTWRWPWLCWPGREISMPMAGTWNCRSPGSRGLPTSVSPSCWMAHIVPWTMSWLSACSMR
jgi:hypothetical protein